MGGAPSSGEALIFYIHMYPLVCTTTIGIRVGHQTVYYQRLHVIKAFISSCIFWLNTDVSCYLY